jgi:hypothetical protein
MPPENIETLQKAIKATHGCDSRWVGSQRVTERFGDQTAWDGIVEIFKLINHPKATTAYVWSYRDGDKDTTMTVLGMSPVDSPDSAVKVAIAAKGKSEREKGS